MHRLVSITRFAAPIIFVLFAAASACSSRTDCEVAQEKLNECDSENAAMTDAFSYRALPLSVRGECSGVNACVASCVNEASCAAITWLEFTGGVANADPNGPPVPEGGGAFNLCLKPCMDLAHGP